MTFSQMRFRPRPGSSTRPGSIPSCWSGSVVANALLAPITFIFSRIGCTSAVRQLLASGMRLIPPAEGDRIRRTVEERIQGLADEDLDVLGYWEFVEGLT